MAALLCLDPIIDTTHGKVRGQFRKTVYDDEYVCFDGIPYAKPPLGSLRFKAPQECEPWTGVRDCTEVAPKCLQYNRYSKEIEGSEDCLYLNIYVKSLQTAKPLPVMIYIHGGMFSTGDPSRLAWAPDYFMMKDVVFVTIGYRMGALGFLSLSDPSLKIPGNAGIKDQVCALKWIRANCSFFNGDPSNITLFGHSSGSMSTQLLMLNPKCVGLFHKAVLMSGYVPNYVEDPNLAYRLAECLGYGGEKNDKKLHEFLLGVDANKLVNLNLFNDEERDRGHFIPFLPTIEPYASDDSILLKQPIELLQSTWSNKIPIMIGNTSDESLIQYKHYANNNQLYETYRSNPEYMLPLELQFLCNIEMQRKIAKNIVNLHYGEKEVAIQNTSNAIELNSYTSFYHPAHRIMLARRSKRTNARTYLYRFDFDSPHFNLYRIKHCGKDIRGVVHVDELSYLFFMPQSFKLSKDSAEFKTIERMVDIWTNFAASSNPNAPKIAPTVWEPLDRNNPDKPHKCLNISNELTFTDWPEGPKCAAWDTLYKEAGVQLF